MTPLNITIGDIIRDDKRGDYGIYSGHFNVSFKDRRVTIEYYMSQEKQATYSAPKKIPKEISVDSQIYTVECAAVPRPKILMGKELEDYQKSFKKPK